MINKIKTSLYFTIITNIIIYIQNDIITSNTGYLLNFIFLFLGMFFMETILDYIKKSLKNHFIQIRRPTRVLIHTYRFVLIIFNRSFIPRIKNKMTISKFKQGLRHSIN